jgi:hypothetical protein
MVYNEPLGRYIMTSWSGAAHPCLLVMQAPHPWGPWELLLEQNREDRDTKGEKPGDWSWVYLMAKFQSADGKKMWMTAQGKCYGLNFMPLYLTTHPAQKYEAEEALLEGTKTSGEKAGFSGKGYVTGFDAGDQCLFRVSVKNTGAYILNVRYNATSSQRMDILVNGAPLGKTTLGKSGKVDTAWADMSFFAWMKSGENTIAFRCGAAGEAADVNLDRLALAFYSDVPGSLPDCAPAAAK